MSNIYLKLNISKIGHLIFPYKPAPTYSLPHPSQWQLLPPSCSGQRILSHSDSYYSLTHHSQPCHHQSGISHHHLLLRLIKLPPNIAPCLNPSNIAVRTFKHKVDHIILLIKILSHSPFYPDKKPTSLQWHIRSI